MFKVKRKSLNVIGQRVGSRHAQPVNHGTSLSDPAATLATACFHKVEHLCERLLDGSDALLAQTLLSFSAPRKQHAARQRLDRGTGKLRADLIFASKWVPLSYLTRTWSRSSRIRRSMSDILTSGGRGTVVRGLSRR